MNKSCLGTLCRSIFLQEYQEQCIQGKYVQFKFIIHCFFLHLVDKYYANMLSTYRIKVYQHYLAAMARKKYF